MLLQERIEELNSAILDIRETNIHITGFLSKERLNDYCNNNIRCFFSQGIYPLIDISLLDFSKIQDDGLFIILKNNEELKRYQFQLLKKDTIKYKGPITNKPLAKIFKIRKCYFFGKLNYIDGDTSLLFDNFDTLNEYFFNRFNVTLQLS